MNAPPLDYVEPTDAHAVSLSVVRMVLPSKNRPEFITAAVTQKKGFWPSLDHDGRWIYGSLTIWGKQK